MHLFNSFLLLFLSSLIAGFPFAPNHPFTSPESVSISGSHNVSLQLFAELEELARIVDIAYCVGTTGVHSPFECASHCSDFKGFQLVNTWNTGLLLSDSCGYIALDHHGQRIIVAFRGTYSVTNTIVDLSTVPQEYVPYPDDPEDDLDLDPHHSYLDLLPNPWKWLKKLKHRLWPSRRDRGNKSGVRQYTRTYGKDKGQERPEGGKCANCTVHTGFFSSWKNTRSVILPHLSHLNELYPSYALHLVGHSLGGAVAALAGLETSALGYSPTVTTFGEPRIGNVRLREYFDVVFGLDGDKSTALGNKEGSSRYRRVTHINDPVPLLPLTEWGYRMHAGEIYISKVALSPTVADLRQCDGDEDVQCIYGGEAAGLWSEQTTVQKLTRQEFSEWSAGLLANEGREATVQLEKGWGLPARYRMWQLFLAHRDYFWRVGLCIPGGDPVNWSHEYEDFTHDDEGGFTTNNEL